MNNPGLPPWVYVDGNRVPAIRQGHLRHAAIGLYRRATAFCSGASRAGYGLSHTGAGISAIASSVRADVEAVAPFRFVQQRRASTTRPNDVGIRLTTPSSRASCTRLNRAPVAQLDRAPASGAGGHRFESCRVYHAPGPLTWRRGGAREWLPSRLRYVLAFPLRTNRGGTLRPQEGAIGRSTERHGPTRRSVRSEPRSILGTAFLIIDSDALQLRAAGAGCQDLRAWYGPFRA